MENIDKLIEYNKVLQKGYANLKVENLYLQQEMSKIKRMLLGGKSERFVSYQETGMESLFDFPEEKEVETEVDSVFQRIFQEKLL